MHPTRLLLRRAVLGGTAALGTLALASGLHGMTTIDSRLETAAATGKPSVTTASDRHDCPEWAARERT